MKSIVKELKRKRQKFHFSKLELTLSVCMQSASLIPLGDSIGDCRHKLFSQSFEEKCSQNMSGGQCDVSKLLV